MECPICGREVNKLVKAEIEGAIIEVCERCASRYGKIISTGEENKILKRIKKVREINVDEIPLVDNYGRIIAERREEMGLSRKEFSQMIKEKESVIKRIENEDMYPDERLLNKIEKTLKINLRLNDVRVEKPRKIEEENLTIGDIVDLK